MRPKRTLLVVVALCLSSAVVAAPPSTNTKEMSMREADTQFTTQLYAQVRGQKGNLFFSPASVRVALAMAYAGARGKTASQMQHALALPAGKQAHEGFAALLSGWDALAHPSDANAAQASSSAEMQKYYEQELERRRIVLHVVNRLWAQTGYHFQEDFLRLLREDYRAPLAELDFRALPEPSRVSINEWVSEQTAKKIPELIAPGLVGKDTRLVLTNAIYFKARWEEPFEPLATHEEPFFVSEGRDIKTPLMHATQRFSFGRFEGGALLELPYASGELVMDVVLPDKRDGLGPLEQQFAEGGWPRWLATLGSARVDVALPRFKTGAAFLLADALGAMGMKQAFAYPGADFSGMDGSHDLFIGTVVHQAMVDVDEAGTEAAAATAVMMKAGSAMRPEKPLVFRADHPFLFLIRDTTSGVTLFAGRLVDPSAR